MGKESGRDLNVGCAPHVGGGHEASKVADDPATKGDDGGTAISSGVEQLIVEERSAPEGFLAFARGDQQGVGGEGGDGAPECFPMKAVDKGVGDDEPTNGLGGGTYQLTPAIEQARADVDLVGAGA